MDKPTLRAIAVLMCFVAVIGALVAVLVATERQLDRMTAQVQEQADLIQAQAGLISAYQGQRIIVADTLGHAASALQLIAYGPYTRAEMQELIDEVADIIGEINAVLAPGQAGEISRAIVTDAVAAGIDPWLLLSVAVLESNCRPEIRGGSGEYGLMQVMPQTGAWIARKLGYENWRPEDMFSIRQNIQFGTYYLRAVTAEFGDPQLGLLAYNRGPTGARSYLREHSLSSNLYVLRVTRIYQGLITSG